MSHLHRLDPIQLRVLGCLIEKQRTTPDQYPLSLNALRLACNQATAREPVLDLDESTVREAVQRLGTIGWSRLASGPGSRTAKYRQLFEEELGLLPSEVAVLAVLLLRGPQTVAELKSRTERLHHYAGNDDVEAALVRLDERELAHLLPKRPGQREERWMHLLGDGPTGAGPLEPAAEPSRSDVASPGGPEPSTLERRLERVEQKLAELERALAERGHLG
ncbi:MAG: YceH family protein [Actinobacteria bacterium]|nr:YceH family protein [Actinomycetota bacterium]